jgi:hypothetical protein
MNKYIIFYIALIHFIVFAFYLELNPALGQIWYRIGADGLRHVKLWNLFDFIIKPLYVRELWYPEYLEFNFFFNLIVLFVCMRFVSFIYRLLDIGTTGVHVSTATAEEGNLLGGELDATHIGTEHGVAL